jgi:hypothetical protein
MQIMSSVIKSLCLFLAMVLCVGMAHAAPIANEKMLNDYRNSFAGSAYHVKYIFVDPQGVSKDQTCCSSDVAKKIYLLDISAKENSDFVYSPELNNLIREHFEITIDNESVVATSEADYLVLTMSRPHEYSRQSTRCAAGMGEDRAYLISIANNQIKVINRKFLDCGDSYRIVHGDGRVGYEVKDYSKGMDQPQSVLYLLRNGKLVRTENGPYKEER